MPGLRSPKPNNIDGVRTNHRLQLERLDKMGEYYAYRKPSFIWKLKFWFVNLLFLFFHLLLILVVIPVVIPVDIILTSLVTVLVVFVLCIILLIGLLIIFELCCSVFHDGKDYFKLSTEYRPWFTSAILFSQQYNMRAFLAAWLWLEFVNRSAPLSTVESHLVSKKWVRTAVIAVSTSYDTKK